MIDPMNHEQVRAAIRAFDAHAPASVVARVDQMDASLEEVWRRYPDARRTPHVMDLARLLGRQAGGDADTALAILGKAAN